MSNVVAVKIFYAKGIRVSMKTKTFKEVVESIFGDSPFSKYDPLKMVFISTGKVLFMDRNAFHAFLSGNISQQELVELTECDELYRNTKEVENIEIGYLWKATLNELTLIDDDQLVQTKLDLKVFEILE